MSTSIAPGDRARERAESVTRRVLAAALAPVAAAIVWSEGWRASRQAITHDEAITYLNWVSQPWSQLTRNYTANNHVLHTVLAKLATAAFGASPFSLRLTALVSGAAFLALLVALSRGAWGGRAAAVLGFASLAFHPVLLDAFACARGYGPASATLLLAMLCMQRLLSAGTRPGRPALLGLGVVLATTVAFQLAFAFGAFGLAATFTLLAGRLHPGTRAWRRILLYTWAPALALLTALLGPILTAAGPNRFRYGTESWRATLETWAPFQFRHVDAISARWSAVTGLDRFVHDWGPILLVALLAITSLGALQALLLVARPSAQHTPHTPHTPATLPTPGTPSPAAVLFALCGGATALTVLATTLPHLAIDLPLPYKRTALPIALFVAVATPSALASIRTRSPGGRFGALSIATLLAVVAALELSVFPASEFAQWRYDTGSERVHHELARLAPPDRPLRVVSLPFWYAPAQNYYRAVNGSTWLLEVDRKLVPDRHYDLALVPRSRLGNPELAPLLGAVRYEDEASQCCIVDVKP